MRSFQVKLSAEYELPAFVLAIADRPWDSVIDFISDILEMRGASDAIEVDQSAAEYLNKMSAMQQQLEQYRNQIAGLEQKCESTVAGLQIANNNEKLSLQSKIAELQQEVTELRVKNTNELFDEKNRIFKQFELKNEQQSRQNNERLDKELQRVNEMYAAIINKNETKYEATLKSLCAQNEARVNDLQKLYESQIQEMRAGLEDRANLKKSLENSHGELVEKLTPLMKFYGGTNMEKGDSGENVIEAILSECAAYQKAKIKNCSGQTSSGDILFKWGRLSCMIEVKNKAAIEKCDIEKFFYDVNNLSNDTITSINCALFISLRTPKIPDRTNEILQVDYVGKIPVVFLYAPPPSKDIHAAIALLDFITQSRDASHEEQKLLTKNFIDCFGMIKELQDDYVKEQTKLNKELKTVQKKLTKINERYNQMLPLYNVLVGVVTTDEDQTESDSAEEPVKPIIISKEQLPEDMNLFMDVVALRYTNLVMTKVAVTIDKLNEPFQDPRVLDVGLEAFMLHAVDQHIKKSLGYYNKKDFIVSDKFDKNAAIAKLTIAKKYVGETGRYLTKPQLIKNEIITEHYAKTISALIGNPNKISTIVGKLCIKFLNSLQE